MAGQSLHSLIQTQMNSKSGKTRVGYTAPQYANVLQYLETYQYVIKKIMGDSSFRPAGDFSPTQGLSSGEAYSTYGDLGALTIKVQKETNWTDDFQGRCKFINYMSFCADKEGKRQHVTVSAFNNATVSSMDQGNSFCGVGTHPATTRTATQNSQWTQDYVVGACIDFTNFLKNYLEKFFGQGAIGADVDELKTIAGKRQMIAEVLIPKTQLREELLGNDEDNNVYSSNFYVIHIPVTLNFDWTGCEFFHIYLPAPLFLLNDFSPLANVLAQVGQGKWEKVGQGNINFPFAGNKYNHKTGTIQGFNKSAFDNATQVQSISDARIEHESEFGFVRVFFDKQAEAALKIDDSKIKNKKELFRGKYDTNKLITRDVVYSSGSIDEHTSSIEEFWQNNVGNNLNPKLQGAAIWRAVKLIGTLESGQNWAAWGPCIVNGKQDGQGISAGFLQFTQLAGGLLAYADSYRRKQSTDSSMPPMPDEMYNDIVKYNKKSEYQLLEERWADQFAKQSKTKGGQIAQLQAWAGTGKGATKRNGTIEWYNKFGCTTPLQFMTIFGAMNHIPEFMVGNKQYYPNDGFKNYITDICRITDATQKALAIEAIHWIEYGIYKYKKKRGWATIDDIIEKGVSGTHSKRFERTKAYILADKGHQCTSTSI